ncbi:Rrf2 family transcriptional regulator [uncultured Aquimarina sp.]|uniref:Rrf2 family transcriptional regulator n=1 Tax=uncultured Aquimarina sp. TaxID=575652 RepID=UPI002634F816|nr:Rrf2 family transcriptional regulator [uncultured Aquimarina sp.]
MVKTRFSIALHIMTLLSMYDNEWLSSTLIASSLNMNAVLVRKEIATLKEGGYVESKEGKNGGLRLLKAANTILLSDIFNLIKGSDTVLSLSKNTPNPNCRVGKQINEKLVSVMDTIDQAISKELQKQNLEEFKNQF